MISNAVGQSSSVPSNIPIRCFLSIVPPSPLDESWQMMRDLVAPRRPVVRYVIPPKVQVVLDALLGQSGCEPLRRLERSGRVFPLTLAAYEDEVRLGSQP